MRRRGDLLYGLAILGGAVVLMAAAGFDSDQVQVQYSQQSCGDMLLNFIVSALISAAWFYGGSRLFGYRPPFGNCVLAAIIPVILLQIAMVLVLFLTAILSCLNIYLAALFVLILTVYLIYLYIQWVARFLEIDSLAVATALVLLPILVSLILGAIL